jgi:hypothetical protein
MSPNNMEIWEQVCLTNPDHTRHVGQRGGFTAIDAMYQVETATRIFGPAGKGWGWNYELIFPPNETVIANVTLWYGKKEQYVCQAGQKRLNSGKGADEDAVKKAVTDGLTKCLSYLGFNADVFLGKFDDNKYVESMKEQFDPENKVWTEWYNTIKDQLTPITSIEELDEWLAPNKDKINEGLKDNRFKGRAMNLMSQYKLIKADLSPQEEKV